MQHVVTTRAAELTFRFHVKTLGLIVGTVGFVVN